MSKKTRTLAALLLVLALLLAGYFTASRLIENRAQKAALAASEALTVTDFSSLDRISYQNELEQLSFIYIPDDGWRCEQHPAWPLKSDLMEDLAASLKSLSADRVLSEPLGLSEYGLDRPAYTIAVEGDGKTTTLYAAYSEPTGLYYLCAVDDTRVFTVGAALINMLEYGINDLVDYETLPTLATDDITAFRLDYGGHSYAFERGEADSEGDTEATYSWSTLRDGENYTPAGSVDSALTDIASLALTGCASFEPTADELAAAGLESPLCLLSVDYLDSNGAAASYTLALGSYSEQSGAYTAEINSNGQLTLIAPDSPDEFLSLISGDSAPEAAE